MTNQEYLYCIKKLNPNAHCVVWQDGDKQWVVWDDAHIGKKPTEKECEAVLTEVQTEINIQKSIIPDDKQVTIGDLKKIGLIK